MSLFEFALTPLKAIQPWGDPPNLSLHWFGLSDGTYHINLGATRLLEYATRAGEQRFVEYYLARLHEDILEMLPGVLEPIPSSVVRQFVDGKLGSTMQHLEKIWEALEETDSSLDVALEALGSRIFDTGYLSPSAGISIWSYGAKTVIEWDNRDRLIDGKPAWTSAHGRHELSRDEFIEEVRVFHRQLMTAMEERVQEVNSNRIRSDVRIEFEQLVAEQAARRDSFDLAVRRNETTDWQTVEMVLSRAAQGVPPLQDRS